MNNLPIRRIAGILLLVQALLIFVPMAIMGPVTGWPATVGDPGAKMLPLVAHHLSTVQVGYFIYLLYSVLFLVTAVTAAFAFRTRSESGPLLVGAVVAASVSSLARCIGILRWVTAFPVLAEAYGRASDPNKLEIARQFDALNRYGGAIGEVLGVGMFAAIWVWGFVGSSDLPRWLKLSGYAVGALLAAAIVELAGIDLGPFSTISGTALHLWFLALAIYALRSTALRQENELEASHQG